MNWKQTTLGEISSNIQTGPFGSQLHQSDYSENGIPVVMPKDILNGHVSDISIARVPEEYANRLNRHKIEPGDILYSRRGDVGRCAFTTDIEAGWLCGTGCLRVTIDQRKAIPKFVFYQLQKTETIGWVEKHAVGSTMLNLNTSILSNVPIQIPSIDKQRFIVGVLSAYDNLIENNQKQIKLLEEAAQRLYKEWFVDLRFPGHENTKITDGVPEGWRRGALADVATFKRGKTITKEQTNPGVVPVVAGGLEPAYFHDTFNTGAPVITVSGSGANAGFTRMYHTKVWASDCSYVDSVATENLAWVYCFLKENNTKIETMQKGAAQPHVYAKDINALEAVIPNDKQMKRFQAITEPMFARIGTLKTQKARLREACNCLLPKLMNGEIEV